MYRILLPFALAASISANAQTITEYRWWLNDDIGTLTTSPIPPALDALVATALAMPSLTRDHCTITLQAKDDHGEWSVPYTQRFLRSTGDATGYAYWIDDVPTSGGSGSLAPNTVVDLIADLPTGVPAGDHSFTIRFSSANGVWSVPLTTAFSSTVGVEELPGITDLLLFPNPVTDQLGLRMNSDAARTLQLEVLDLSGALVRDLSTWSVAGTMHRNWDISALASGSYLLRITGEHGSWTTRFVKP